MAHIAVLTIGQTPRPDLVAPLEHALPNHTLQIIGALDGLEAAEIPSAQGAAYPLVTRLATGETVYVPEAEIGHRLSHQLGQLSHCDAAILLCAGTFATLSGPPALVKPFTAGQKVLKSMAMRRVGFIAPFEGQVAPIHARWEAVGIVPTVWAADLGRQDAAFMMHLQQQVENNQLQAILLDYVGHPVEQVAQLQAHSPVPVIDLGMLAVELLSALVA